MPQKTILIGEDEKDISEMYRLSFENAGFKVITAYDGQEVIDKAKSESPHLVLLDINMPVKDGFEVLKEVSENIELYKVFSRIPIIILSNYSNPQDMEYCLKKGAQSFIVKSDWTPKLIVKRVSDFLENLDN
jgi:two-component system, OmpR family, alkaline phosphatase synthesis response regulator PhoP